MSEINTIFYKRNYLLLLVAALFFTLAFVIYNYWSVTSAPKTLQWSIQNQIDQTQKKVNSFLDDSASIDEIIQDSLKRDQLYNLASRDFFIFLYKKTDSLNFVEKFWNTQATRPDTSVILQITENSFVKLSNGWFYTTVKDFYKDDNQYRFVCLVPVKWEYYIENKYLQNHFEGLPFAEKAYDIHTSGTGLPITDLNGNPIFYLEKATAHRTPDFNWVVLSLAILGLFALLIFIHRLSHYIGKRYGLIRGITSLVVSLIILRVVSYILNPFDFRQLSLFAPVESELNFFSNSLGELFVNSLIFIWIILYIRYHISFRRLKIQSQKKILKYIYAFLISLFMAGTTFGVGRIIVNLISGHQISFDVLNFFSLNIYSFIGFIVLTCLAAGFFFLNQIMLQLLRSLIPDPRWIRYTLISAAGLLILSFTEGSQVNFRIVLLLWLLLFVFLLDLNALLLQAYKLVSSQFIFWTFFFSISIAAVILVQNRAKELDARMKFAENLSDKADPSGPVIMNIILTDFRTEYLSKIFYRFRDPLESLSLKDSLVNESFSGYLNKYNTEIYTFDTLGVPLYNLRPVSYNDLSTIIQTQGKETGVPDLYYYDVSYSNFNYISRKIIYDSSGNKQGYIFIVSRPKKFRSETMYPELFSRGNKNSLESSSEYAFAIYNNGRLTTSYNDYPFNTQINEGIFTYNGFKNIRKQGYEELWYRPKPGKIIIITHQDRFLLESITLFAYLFCSFLLITLGFNLFGYIISDSETKKQLTPIWQLSIRNQVHGIIILISLFSFIVIGVSTIIFFINRYHNSNREFLSRTIHVMENELHSTLDSSTARTLNSRSLDQVSRERLSQIITNVSNIHTTDINLYNLDGTLEVSSLYLPYEEGILSDKMDPIAWYHLNKLKESQFFGKQKIGTLEYLSNYIPVRNEDGRAYAYLNIPYYESQKKLQDEISNFLVAIINLNAFIFLIAGIIALFITNRITKSFSFISDKMKLIKFQEGNEEIEWHRKDEIGELVDEYNKMVRQLELSVQKLAKSEREGAWQEMARQVAHEIKNPLTPMKLNLQYLQMAIEKNSPDVRSISLYVSNIMLEQIEHLSNIANDFSQFANLGNISPQIFNINEVLENVVSLYATNEKVDIKAEYDEALTVNADKTQMNRLFTNLLQNAVQSVPEFRNIKISIKSRRVDDNAVISIRDNGTGIPQSLQSKIFTPNFTTKSSGTGLGLAMCKGIVERINGTISFETKENEWTEFTVSLPLYKKPG